MRLINITAACLMRAGPLFALCQPAHAEQNDLLGQAQQFLGDHNNQGDQNAYQRGREDERRREQARRDRQGRQDPDQRWSDRDRDLSQGHRNGDQDRETYNYNRYP